MVLGTEEHADERGWGGLPRMVLGIVVTGTIYALIAEYGEVTFVLA